MRYIDSSEDIKVLPWIVVETGTLYIRRGHFIVTRISITNKENYIGVLTVPIVFWTTE